MSHEEIWDDSALVESWDEAVAEYKRYHSIHARGEKVEDVLKGYEEKANVQATNAKTTNGNDETLVENGMIVDERREAGIANETRLDETSKNVEATARGEPAAATETTPSLAPPLPPHLVGSVQDEALKNLLMSWYYAGYYTGLYEGEKKGQQMAKQSDSQ